MGLLSFLFSLGCLAGLLLEGWLTVVVGRIRLVFLLEVLCIVNCYMYTVNSYHLLLLIRVTTGFISGLTSAFIPALCRDMFPPSKASLGAVLTYLFIVAFTLIAGLQDIIFGGRAGMKEHFKLIICWPLVFGILRAVLLCWTLLRVESPEYWLETFTGDDEKLRRDLQAYYSIIYLREDADELAEIRIEDKHQDLEDHDEGQGFLQMFSHKYKRRFVLGVLLYQFKILGGINILWFFSTYIFNRVSGNGNIITIVIGVVNMFSGIVAMYFQRFKRLVVYQYSLLGNLVGMLGVTMGV